MIIKLLEKLYFTVHCLFPPWSSCFYIHSISINFLFPPLLTNSLTYWHIATEILKILKLWRQQFTWYYYTNRITHTTYYNKYNTSGDATRGFYGQLARPFTFHLSFKKIGGGGVKITLKLYRRKNMFLFKHERQADG